MKYFLIVNPLSKFFKKNKLNDIDIIFSSKGIYLEKFLSNYPQHCVEIAYNICKKYINESITIISVGGDGTINEICQGIIKSEHQNVKVGIIPGGTANVIAKELDIPENNLKNCIDIIVKQNFKIIFLNKIDEKFFLFTCGIGFDGIIVEKVNLKLKKLTGKFAYILSGIRTLSNLKTLTCFKVILDNKRNINSVSVIINKTKKYAGNFLLFKDANLFGESFSVLIFRKLNLKILIKFLFNIFIKKDFSDTNEYFFTECKNILIETNNSLSIQLDGDFFGKNCSKISISNNDVIKLIVP